MNAYQNTLWYLVNSEVIVKYKDKFAQDSGISDENDKRRLEIDIESYTWMKIAATRRLATSTLFRTDANGETAVPNARVEGR